MKKFREESDSFGSIKVPKDAYFGAQTARSLHHFAIGNERMPKALIYAFGILKKAAAITNFDLQTLSLEKKNLIVKAADEIIQGKLYDEFPLSVWQTGSGTQTNMNVNEVISNRAIAFCKGTLGSKKPIHPNDDVNRSQSSNDAFPTAMHIASATLIQKKLLPSLKSLARALETKAKAFKGDLKIGRTHLQDATPITVGQEFSGYASLVSRGISRLEIALDGLYDLALGGTAVGTGLNAPSGFAKKVAKKIGELTHLPFRSHPNKFAALSSHDELLFVSATLKTIATSLMKIANDIRWLGSGPRCGLQELHLPANEPGSSIMPGKVNPTQGEALAMVAIQVMANDSAVTFANAHGELELNVFKPMMIYNLIQSIEILSDSCSSFTKFCIEGIRVNRSQIARNVEHSLMLVTALVPKLGYDLCAKVAKYALSKKIPLKRACVDLKILSAKEFDRIVDPAKMTHT